MSDSTFNSWGEKYMPYDNDAAIGRGLAEHFGVERFTAPMVTRGRPLLIDGTPIVETYINSYFANGALIVPTGGTADDEAALERLREIVPGHEVVGVSCPVIGHSGGIHCITQQVPQV